MPAPAGAKDRSRWAKQPPGPKCGVRRGGLLPPLRGSHGLPLLHPTAHAVGYVLPPLRGLLSKSIGYGRYRAGLGEGLAISGKSLSLGRGAAPRARRCEKFEPFYAKMGKYVGREAHPLCFLCEPGGLRAWRKPILPSADVAKKAGPRRGNLTDSRKARMFMIKNAVSAKWETSDEDGKN